MGEPPGERDRADPPSGRGATAPSAGGTDRAVTGSRRVFFDDWIDTPPYNRPDLAPGDVVSGPAIIEEFGSTVPVHPGFAVTVDAYGNLLLTKENAR